MYVTGALVMIFEVVLALNDDGCSIYETSKSGIIKSKNYPSWYSNNLECSLTIRSPTLEPITLVFEDFILESDSHGDCQHDYVQLQDGDEISLGKYCGNTIPDPVIALSGTLVMEFHTDHNVMEKGFKAFFNDSQDCTHLIRKTAGSIESPKTYPDKTICLYLIQSVNGLPINLTFTRFEVEYHSSCKKDSLIIKDRIGKSDSRFGPFCGDELPKIPMITNGAIFIIFKSNEFNSLHGFSAIFREEAFLDCSGHLNVTSGRIQSPNYPDNYDSKQDCTYHLSSIHNYPINLTFIDFHLHGSIWGDCYDYVEISTENAHEQTLCGSKVVPLQFTLGKSVKIIFHSSGYYEEKGFYAVFTEIPEQTTTVTSANTKMEYSDSTISVSPSTEQEMQTITQMSKSYASYSTLASSINGNTGSTVPLIAGIVAGIVICTMVIAAIVIWFLRKKPLKQKHQPKAFGNDNYNVQYISKENISSGVNDNVSYCNVQNNIPTDKKVGVEEGNSSFIHHQSTTSEYNYATTKNGFRSSIGDVNKTESDYIDQEDSYNILNVNPNKTSTTENIYDRSTEGAYDSAQTFATQSSQDVGTYDRYPANGDNDYDTAQDIMSRDDSYIYS